MKIQSLKCVYFSPTGTTRKIIETIARGVHQDRSEQVDISEPDARTRTIETAENDLLVVGVPVYFGRVQSQAIQGLNAIKGHNTPTVCVVVYGNREYDDALLELQDTMTHAGCIPIACAAYIGEHSFSTPETPIAPGRPDAADIAHAQRFGENIRDKILSITSPSQIPPVAVPGQYPYIEMENSKKNLSNMDWVTVDGHCVHCGACARHCPVGAIHANDSASVDKAKCILCHACIKYCPVHARIVTNDTIKAIAHRLSNTLQDRKEPQLFW